MNGIHARKGQLQRVAKPLSKIANLPRRVEAETLHRTQDLRQWQRMAILERLVAGSIHDLNNHLTVIDGYADLLLSTLQQNAPGQDELVEIAGAVERSRSLLRELTAFHRRQIDQTATHSQALDVNEVIVSAECHLRRLAGKDIELTIEYDPNLGLVRADPAQIELILLVLVTRVREALAGAGTIVLCTANAEVEHTGNGKDTPGSYVAISMCGACDDLVDGSRGSTPERCSTTRARGLCASPDLFVVKEMVRECGGHIEVEESGHSVSLILYLPGIDGAGAVMI